MCTEKESCFELVLEEEEVATHICGPPEIYQIYGEPEFLHKFMKILHGLFAVRMVIVINFSQFLFQMYWISHSSVMNHCLSGNQ